MEVELSQDMGTKELKQIMFPKFDLINISMYLRTYYLP